MRATGPVALVMISLAFGVVVTGSGAVGAVPATSPRPAGSYCQAALAVAQFQGRDGARLDGLIDRALARAHAEPVATHSLRTMRTAELHSKVFAVARSSFTAYNTGHCCECHAAPAAPELLAPPPQAGART